VLLGNPLSAGRMKTPFGGLASRSSSASLRPALAATTNQLAVVGLLDSPKSATGKAADFDIAQESKMAAMVCSLENKDECLMCGS
jgi:hypothetical protein